MYLKDTCILMFFGIGLVAIGFWLVAEPDLQANAKTDNEAGSQILGGANDGYYRGLDNGCGAYSKVGQGGVQLRCAFETSTVDANWITGIWGSPGLTQNCTQCGVACGSVRFLGSPTES